MTWPVATPLHGAPTATPVPGWLVLLLAVPALWLFISSGVLIFECLLRRCGS